MDGRDSSTTRNALLGLLGVLLLLVVLWAVSGSEPTEVAIEDAASQPPSEPEGAASGADPQERTTPDGTWVVDATVSDFSLRDTSGTFVGYRIDVELGTVGPTTAVGRTPVVGGSLMIDGPTVVEAAFTADLSALASDSSRRDDAARRVLRTADHPEARFELTEAIDLGRSPARSSPIEVDATGKLMIAGVTRTVTLPLEAIWTEQDVIVVTGTVDVTLSDHDIDAPDEADIVVSMSDSATLELQLFLTR